MKTIKEINDKKKKALRLKKLEANTDKHFPKVGSEDGSYGDPRNVRALGS